MDNRRHTPSKHINIIVASNREKSTYMIPVTGGKKDISRDVVSEKAQVDTLIAHDDVERAILSVLLKLTENGVV